MQIDIIGVPIDLGADRRGVDMGPSAIRYAHLHQKLGELGYTLEDKGNIEVPILETCQITDPRLKYLDCILPMGRRIAGAVATSIQGKHFPLVLGGDHSLSVGSIRGAAKHKKLGVIWVDAHADFNTAETTPSGNIHGMPLAALCGLGDPRLVCLWDETPPVIDPKRVAVIGARDLDLGEKRNLREAGVMVQSMEQIDRIGMVSAIEKAVDRVSRDVDGIYLSFDMDSLDPRHAPGRSLAAHKPTLEIPGHAVGSIRRLMVDSGAYLRRPSPTSAFVDWTEASPVGDDADIAEDELALLV